MAATRAEGKGGAGGGGTRSLATMEGQMTQKTYTYVWVLVYINVYTIEGYHN